MSKKSFAVLLSTLVFSAPAISQPYSWNLSRDVMTPSVPPSTYLSLNPTVPVSPANGVWTFAQLAGGNYSALPIFNTACAPSLSIPLSTTICWAAKSSLPLIGASPTDTVNLNNGFSQFDLIQGMVLMHPANNASAVVSWRSPLVSSSGTAGFAGNVRILGRITDLDTKCGDGVRFRIRKSTVPGPLPIPFGSTIPVVPSTTSPAGPATIFNSSKSFSVNFTSVVPGTEILFEVDKLGNELCDSTSLDVLITSW